MCNEQGQPSNPDFQFAEAAGVDSAGAGSWEAPSCDTDGSAVFAWPVVGQGAPLEWDTYPIAGVGQKLSWGSGGDAPGVSGVIAGGGLSSLDSLKNNRNTGAVDACYRRPLGRGKFCGRWSIQGVDPETGRQKFRRINCGSWNCSYCGPRKARTARAAIRRVAEDLNLNYFLTLTLDPSKLENEKQAVPYLRLCFNKFRLYLKRKYGVPPSYICVLEFTQKGVPHLHILFDRYIDQKWISRVWDSLGGGRIVFIKQVSVLNVAKYLSKYLTKELLLSAPKGSRRITTARSIKLFPHFNSKIVWELVKSSIFWLLMEQQQMERDFEQDLFNHLHLTVEYDEESYLKAFEVVQTVVV